LEVGRDLVGLYPDGVWLVELAPVSEGELMVQVVANALGVREVPGRYLTDALVETLKKKQMLLLLDNCEHLLDACAYLVDTLLASCPHLRILATSRESLGVAGEAVWVVSSLSVPRTDRLPAAGELTRYDAVRLFVDRARLRLPDFDLTSANGRGVAEVCTRLEGMPLAIELATARMGTLAVDEIAQRLEDSLKHLTAGPRTVEPRHRTMRATLEWSHELLSEPERVLFRRLSVFAGGWTLEAAEAVCTGGAIEEGDILDLMAGLVDKSLVVPETFGEGRVRYRLLEPVRQYARERLEESGEADAIGHHHAALFLAQAETAEPDLRGGRQEEWLQRLEAEHANFRTALLWVLEREGVELSLRFGAILGEFWYMRGHLSEGRRWLETALAKGDAPSVARVRALAKASWIATEQADLERATALGEEGLKLARKLGDEEGTATAFLNLGMAVMSRGELERSKALLEEGLPLFRGLGDLWGLARSLLSLGFVAMFQGDKERASALIEECLAVSRESGDVWSSGMALIQMALMALLREDYGKAEALCKETMELSRRSGMQHHITLVLHTSAALAGSRGQLLRSARLWGAAEALREAMGTVFTPLELRTYRPYIAAARAQVEDAAWEAAWQKGRAMSMEEVIDYVLSERKASNLPAALAVLEEPKVAEPPHVLSRRERDVATLVARGLTNRQIAAELSISEHTVANHVAKILRKLGLESRSQITAWVVERRTPP
jgi:non-specific serine/threonine protein kinase